MSQILEIINEFKKECPCGKEHKTAIKDVQIGSGLVHKVGEILKKNDFEKTLLVVADNNTLAAAEGILESLKNFNLEYKICENLRVATMEHVEEIEKIIKGRNISVISIGTGSLNDICRVAVARQNKKFCIFATAPSMDGFASYSAPIVAKGFKASYPAKSPEVIIGDTKILANAPTELKSAGFGDMIAKYVALVDWKVSGLLIGEYHCERIESLTRNAVDELMTLADKVCENDELTAGKIFEALLKTGIAMSFTENSRPASGSEHMIAHLMECVELRDDIVPNFHGEDVGVCTLKMLKVYEELAQKESIEAKKEEVDWNRVYDFYGNMAEDVRKLNEPDNIIDLVNPADLESKWGEIVKVIRSIPSYDLCESAMKKAGCKITIADIGKTQEFYSGCAEFSPFMRKRLTLYRLKNMIK